MAAGAFLDFMLSLSLEKTEAGCKGIPTAPYVEDESHQAFYKVTERITWEGILQP